MILCDMICVGIMCYGLGMFTAFFLYGWFEERSDRYDSIKWDKELDTCINWDLRLCVKDFVVAWIINFIVIM